MMLRQMGGREEGGGEGKVKLYTQLVSWDKDRHPPELVWYRRSEGY